MYKNRDKQLEEPQIIRLPWNKGGASLNLQRLHSVRISFSPTRLACKVADERHALNELSKSRTRYH